MKKLPSRTVLVSATLLLALSACSGSDTDSAPADDSAPAPAESSEASDASSESDPAGGTEVNIKDSRYDPTEIDVAVGDTVTFTNNDAFAHTVTSKKDQELEFASGEFTDEAFEFTFEEAGSFAYFCEIHPTMKATVNVS